MHKIDTLDFQILSIFEWISPLIHKKSWILLFVHINDIGDTRNIKYCKHDGHDNCHWSNPYNTVEQQFWQY